MMFTLCFSLVSALKCVDGGEYKSGESKKTNVQCDDVKFCANFTYRGIFSNCVHSLTFRVKKIRLTNIR